MRIKVLVQAHQQKNVPDWTRLDGGRGIILHVLILHELLKEFEYSSDVRILHENADEATD